MSIKVCADSRIEGTNESFKKPSGNKLNEILDSVNWIELPNHVINGTNFKRGLITIDTEQIGIIPIYLCEEKNEVKKYGFLYPHLTKDKSKHVITFEVIPDIGTNEIIHTTYYGWKKLSSDLAEIKEDLNKYNYKLPLLNNVQGTELYTSRQIQQELPGVDFEIVIENILSEKVDKWFYPGAAFRGYTDYKKVYSVFNLRGVKFFYRVKKGNFENYIIASNYEINNEYLVILNRDNVVFPTSSLNIPILSVLAGGIAYEQNVNFANGASLANFDFKQNAPWTDINLYYSVEIDGGLIRVGYTVSGASNYGYVDAVVKSKAINIYWKIPYSEPVIFARDDYQIKLTPSSLNWVIRNVAIKGFDTPPHFYYYHDRGERALRFINPSEKIFLNIKNMTKGRRNTVYWDNLTERNYGILFLDGNDTPVIISNKLNIKPEEITETVLKNKINFQLKSDLFNRSGVIFKNMVNIDTDVGTNNYVVEYTQNSPSFNTLKISGTSNFRSETGFITTPTEYFEDVSKRTEIQNMLINYQTLNNNYLLQERNFNLSLQQDYINNIFGIVGNVFNLFGNVGTFFGDAKFYNPQTAIPKLISNTLSSGLNLTQSQTNYRYDQEIKRNNGQITSNNYQAQVETLKNLINVKQKQINSFSSWQTLLPEADKSAILIYIKYNKTLSQSDRTAGEILLTKTGYPINLNNKPITYGINVFESINLPLNPFNEEIQEILTRPFFVYPYDLPELK